MRYPCLALPLLRLALILPLGVACSDSQSAGSGDGAASDGGAAGDGGSPISEGGSAGEGGAGGDGGGSPISEGGSAGEGATVPVPADARLMVLGSSNELSTCWRAFLWQKLQAADLTNVDFVGDVTSGPDCGVPGYDQDLRARSGIIISNLTDEQFATWFEANPARIILMHFGGADLISNLPIPGIIDAYTRALAQARQVTPDVILLAGQHTPIDSPDCECTTTVPELNAAMTTWAAEVTTATSPVIPIDLFTGLDLDTDFSDRVHLNESGSEKVAQRFFDALSPLFAP